MAPNKKRPYRLAVTLAVGALVGLIGTVEADQPTVSTPIPATEFRALVLADLRTGPRSTAAARDRSTPPPSPALIVLDQPWPEAQPPQPSRAPLRIPPPKLRSEPLHPPKSHAPHRGSIDGAVHGVATWYCWPAYPSRCTVGYPSNGAYAAAGPELRRAFHGHYKGKVVYVNGVRVTLIDFCACGGNHVIDVYHSTWVTIPHQSNATITW